MIYTAKLRRSCGIVETATMDVQANSAAEAFEMARWLSRYHDSNLEWHEDPDQFEEFERTVWVIDPDKVMILGAGCISTDDSNPSGTGETPVASTKIEGDRNNEDRQG